MSITEEGKTAAGLPAAPHDSAVQLTDRAVVVAEGSAVTDAAAAVPVERARTAAVQVLTKHLL